MTNKKQPKNTDAYLVNGSLVIPFPNAVEQIAAGKPMRVFIKKDGKLVKTVKIN